MGNGTFCEAVSKCFCQFNSLEITDVVKFTHRVFLHVNAHLFPLEIEIDAQNVFGIKK